MNLAIIEIILKMQTGSACPVLTERAEMFPETEFLRNCIYFRDNNFSEQSPKHILYSV